MYVNCVVSVTTLLLAVTKLTNADEVVLLDTTKLDVLNWHTSADNGDRGWREASYNSQSGETLRVYSVCQVTSQRSRNWLRLPDVDVSDVSRLFIELRFTMRQCTRYPDSSQIWRCKENIRLFYSEDDSPDVERYKVLDVIAADETFTDVTDSNVPVNVETRSIVVTSLKRVTFALLDEGSCVMLLSVKVYHYMCPQVTTSLALFDDTPTGEIEGGVVTREGVCVANAKVTQLHGRPTFYCKADGHWYLLKGACMCDEGYQSTYDGTACLPVSGNAASPVTGGGEETSSSTTVDRQAAMTRRTPPQLLPRTGKLHSTGDEVAGGVREVTSSVKPRLRLSSADVGSVSVTWSPSSCTSRAVTQAELCYQAVNVSYADDVTCVFLGSCNITVIGLEEGREFLFRVRVQVDGRWSNFSSFVAVVTAPAGGQGQAVARLTAAGQKSEGGVAGGVVILVGCLSAGALCIFLFALTALFISYRKRLRLRGKKTFRRKWEEFYGHSKGSASATPLCKSPLTPATLTPVSCVTSAVESPFYMSGHVTHTYDLPRPVNHYENILEIDAKRVIIESILSKDGQFGDVCVGELRHTSRDKKKVVLKTLRPNSSVKRKVEFLRQVDIMNRVQCATVVRLEGVITRIEPLVIVTELAANGSLDRLLQSQPNIEMLRLVEMLRDVAAGLSYAQDMGVLHRNLLAKNILVDSKFTCKISSWQHAIVINNVQEDSGLYTAVQDDGYVTPRRWAAPEVVHNRLYSVHSDIWALGVVAWETVSRGCLPYAALADDEVTASVVNGYRLPRPKDCPLSLYDLMMRCWAEKCETRVACHDLVQALLALLPTLSPPTSMTSPAALWLRGVEEETHCYATHIVCDEPVPTYATVNKGSRCEH